MSYKTLGYSTARRILANCDKMSFRSQSRRVNSPFGTICICKPRVLKCGKVVRQFSVSGSTILHNGGGYTIGGLRKRLLGL